MHKFLNRFGRLIFVPALLIAAAGLLSNWPSQAAPNAQVNVRLSGERPSSGPIMSPNGRYVAYAVYSQEEQVNDLFIAPATGQSPQLQLSAPLPNFTSFREAVFTPDSANMIYIAPQKTAVVDELFAVAAGGGDQTRLNGALPDGGMVSSFILSPSGKVVYMAEQDTDDVYEIYSVPIGGGATTRLNGVLVENGDVYLYQADPAGDRVVYAADQDVDELIELYSVPISGGVPTKLNGPMAATDGIGSDIFDFHISPLGGQVVYLADQDADEIYELFSVPINGGAVTKLNGMLPAGGDVFVSRISPAGDRVVYKADQTKDEVIELYSVPIHGGPPIKLNGALVKDGGVYNFQINPAGDRVVYAADQDVDEQIELYSVPMSGGLPVKLNGSMVDGGDLAQYGDEFQISPRGDRVVYIADQDTVGVNELYSVPIGGGPATKLNGPLVAGGGVIHMLISDDGSQVLYTAEQDTDNISELYNVPIGGGAVHKVNGPLVSGGNVAPYQILQSPDNSIMVYQAGQEEHNERPGRFATFDDNIILTPTPMPDLPQQVYFLAVFELTK